MNKTSARCGGSSPGKTSDADGCGDTHTIVWYLSVDSRLSASAAAVLDSATAAGEHIRVPSICLEELTYLVEKGRLPLASRDRLISEYPFLESEDLNQALRFAAAAVDDESLGIDRVA